MAGATGELRAVAEGHGLNGEELVRTSRLTARMGDTDKLQGFARLDRFTRSIEQHCRPQADFEAVVAHEHAISRQLNGRTVFDDRKLRRPRTPESCQLSLFD